jgi:adenylate cyclase
MQAEEVGDGVNLGSRLESISKQYGCDIIISDNTYNFCSGDIWARELDLIRVKGRNEPVSIYELIGMRFDPINDTKQELIKHYQKGREYYLQRQFSLAQMEFVTALTADNNDKASMLYLSRCQHWLQTPPTDTTWDDGVWTFNEK